jgi:YHS domain-containing protein
MDVDEKRPPGGTSEYKGKTYYFCAPGCKVVFDRAPAEFAGEERQSAKDE